MDVRAEDVVQALDQGPAVWNSKIKTWFHKRLIPVKTSDAADHIQSFQCNFASIHRSVHNAPVSLICRILERMHSVR